MKKIEVNSGDKYGRLTVVKELDRKITGGEPKRWFLFKCDCGNTVEIFLADVRRGHTMSCGCLAKEVSSQTPLTHGLRKDPLYSKWSSIKTRCYNPNISEYVYYGGRGISMYEEWISNPESFILYCKTLKGWDDPLLTIDRINVNGNYEPGNIRFTTPHVQCCNQRKRKSKSPYTGVTKVGDVYVSEIQVNYIKYFLGTHLTPEDAVIARNKFIRDNNLKEYIEQILLKP